MTTHSIADRDIRQREIVPPDRLAACKATVIGVGAIGRQVALQLAAIGVSQLELVDFDKVEPANLACQGYFEADLEQPKVEATAALCRQINSSILIDAVNGRFQRSRSVGNILFCCVDSIATRRLIWEAVETRVEVFIDGRMSAEVLRIVTASDGASRRHYPTTLFAAERAYAGSCTAKSTIYCANIAAGLMLSQFTKWLRGLLIDADVQINLLANEFTVGGDQNGR